MIFTLTFKKGNSAAVDFGVLIFADRLRFL